MSFCEACGAPEQTEKFCTACGAPQTRDEIAIKNASQPVTSVAPAQVVQEIDPYESRRVQSGKTTGREVAGKVLDGAGRVAGAVVNVFAIVIGICWVGFGLLVIIGSSMVGGNFLGILIGIAFIIYGGYLVVPGSGSKWIIY